MSPSDPVNAIVIDRISKRFGKLQALNEVSFVIPRASVFCILGPNGAGKTTLLRILTTISRPTSGEAWIEGHPISTQVLQIRQLIGIVAQDNHFDTYFPLSHNLTMHAQMHGMPKAVYEPKIAELLKKVGLYDRRFSLPGELSGGMQRRVALIRALIHEPKILFLDEPTTGLDPHARREIWETIEQFKQTATVILTTHYMEEADRLADRILLLNHGQVVREGTPRELKLALSPVNRYELVLNTPIARETARKLAPATNGNGQCLPPGSLVDVVNDYELALTVPHQVDLKTLLSLVDNARISRVGQVEADLEDVFLALATGQVKSGGGDTL